MVNKPRAIGTAGESAVANWLKDNGHPYCERRSLNGSLDKGDLTGIPGLCVEIKAGNAAHNSTPANITKWMAETRCERENSQSDIGLLICKRQGYGALRVGEWWAWMTLAELLMLHGQHRYDPRADAIRIRMELADANYLLRRAGYGDAL